MLSLEPGLEGLLHVSEMSWDKKVRNPSKLVSKGDILELQVLDIDKEKKRISLGLKQLRPDPWKELAAKYPAGSVVTGKVKNFTDFGLFVGMEDGIDGLVHISEISLVEEKERHCRKLQERGDRGGPCSQYRRGAEEVLPEHQEAEGRPWKGLPDRYHVGDVVEGYVTSITDFGVFVEIEEGIEGLIHLSEIENGKGKHPSEIVQGR